MTTAEALAPAIQEARHDIASEQAEGYAPSHPHIGQLRVRLAMLETLAKTTVSETAGGCGSCALEGIHSWMDTESFCQHPKAEGRVLTYPEQTSDAPPDWCPLRPENGGPVLVTLRTK